MAYNVRRNSKTGYVSLVSVKRKKGTKNGQIVKHIAGFGSMSKTEFAQFKKYAHGIENQEERLRILLSDSRCVKERESLPKKSVQKAEPKQKKQPRTGFRYPKQTEEDIKRDMEIYKRNIQKEKEKELKMTHTERMMLKRDERRHKQIKASHGMDLSKYHSNRERVNVLNDRIKEIDKYIDYQNRNIKNASQKFAIDRDRLPEYQHNRSVAIEAKEILKEQKRSIEK